MVAVNLSATMIVPLLEAGTERPAFFLDFFFFIVLQLILNQHAVIDKCLLD